MIRQIVRGESLKTLGMKVNFMLKLPESGVLEMISTEQSTDIHVY